MHPWMYGSRVGAWLGPLVYCSMLQETGVEAEARATEQDRVNTTTCVPGTYDKLIFIDNEKSMLIPTQLSRGARGEKQQIKRQ